MSNTGERLFVGHVEYRTEAGKHILRFSEDWRHDVLAPTEAAEILKGQRSDAWTLDLAGKIATGGVVTVYFNVTGLADGHGRLDMLSAAPDCHPMTEAVTLMAPK